MSESYREIINVPDLTSSTYEEFIQKLRNTLSDLADAGVFKGDRGENVSVSPLRILNIEVPTTGYLNFSDFNIEGQRLLKAIFGEDAESVLVEDMRKKLEFFKEVTDYAWWCIDGDTDKAVFPATSFLYIDPTAYTIKKDKTVSDKLKKDFSCILTPKLILDASNEEEYVLSYSKSEILPTFWFNPLLFNGRGGWCWKINGVETDIPASAANDSGDYNNKLFLISVDDETGEYKYFTALGEDVSPSWHTLEEMRGAGLRIPLEGDLGYNLIEESIIVGEESRDIWTLKICIYSGSAWTPASVGGTDILIKYDDAFMSYIWDSIRFKEIIIDTLYIGRDGVDAKGQHMIDMGRGESGSNPRQFEVSYHGDEWSEQSGIESRIASLKDHIKQELERSNPRTDIIKEWKDEIEELSEELNENEQGINIKNYYHINLEGPEDESGSKKNIKININGDITTSSQGETVIKNEVKLENNTQDKTPSLTVSGYKEVKLINLSGSDFPILLGSDTRIVGNLDTENIQTKNVNATSISSSGELRGESLNVKGVTADSGILTANKLIASDSNSIEVVPKSINDTISSLKKTTSYIQTYISSKYIGEWRGSGETSVKSRDIDLRNSSSTPFFTEFSVKPGYALDIPWTVNGQEVAVGASITFNHFSTVSFWGNVTIRVETKLNDSSNWKTIYRNSNEDSSTDYCSDYGESFWGPSGFLNSGYWVTDYITLVSRFKNTSKLNRDNISCDNSNLYKAKIDDEGIHISPIQPSNYSLNVRISVDCYAAHSDSTVWWQGCGSIGVTNIIPYTVGSLQGLNNATTYSLSNLSGTSTISIPISTTQTSTNGKMYVCSDGVLWGADSSNYRFIKLSESGILAEQREGGTPSYKKLII